MVKSTPVPVFTGPPQMELSAWEWQFWGFPNNICVYNTPMEEGTPFAPHARARAHCVPCGHCALGWENSSGRRPDAGRTIGFKGTDACRTWAWPFLPGREHVQLMSGPTLG
eukprot:gene15899-biopygen8203